MPADSTLASFSISRLHAPRHVSSIIPARSLPQETTIEPTLSFPYIYPFASICVHLRPPCTNLHNWLRTAAHPQ